MRMSHEAVVEFLDGVKGMLPMLLGIIPFGVTYGVLGLAAGLNVSYVLGMSSIVFAGSAQIVAVQLLNAAVPALVILVTILMVNLRHVLYSASLAPQLRNLQSRWKWLLSYLLTDEAYAVTIAHYNRSMSSQNKHWFFFGAGLTMWSTWQASTAIGVFVGAIIPKNLPLDFVVTLTFIALLVPMLKDKASVIVSISAGIVALLASEFPFRLNLILAVVVAVAIGLSAERFEETRRSASLV
jgi:4-azaleucine resistance transporter AzlC